jgi:hypothetical protein
MIRKSGSRFSEKIMLHKKEHDPEKWKPVFRKDHVPLKTLSEGHGLPRGSCTTQAAPQE